VGAGAATAPLHTVVDIQCATVVDIQSAERDNSGEAAWGRVTHLQAVTVNDSVLAEREQGILSINRTVRHTKNANASNSRAHLWAQCAGATIDFPIPKNRRPISACADCKD